LSRGSGHVATSSAMPNFAAGSGDPRDRPEDDGLHVRHTGAPSPLPPCEGDARQGREGLFSRTFATLGILSCLLLAQPAAAAVDKPAVEAQFRVWLEKTVWPEAEKNKVPRATFDAAFKGVSLNWSLPDLVAPGETPPEEQKQSQAEFSTPAPYFDEKSLSALALKGRQIRGQHQNLLTRIEATYGVPGDIVMALWGRETAFGAGSSPYPAMQVLATKAFMSTRKDLFLKELVAALQISDEDKIDPQTMKSSWAGAMGQPQFMPSSFLKYAVDFDRDGKVDIWNSVPDALASIANYMAQKGWQRGRSWGVEATVPDGVSCAQEGPDLAQPIAKWVATGIGRVDGKPFSATELKSDGMMMMPAGRFGPQFIVTPNFYVLKDYNNSDLYALYVGNLADRIANPRAGGFAGKWGDVGHMLRSDVQAMQEALVSKGYDVGKVDGLPGYKTRRSIGDFEMKNGLKQTCYPDAALKAKLHR
jgi:lytic murein transglycosylase